MIPKDTKLLIPLVLTSIVNIELLAFCFIAFKMGNTGIDFLFAFLTLVAFVGCLVEGFILYGYYVNALVDKGKGIITLLSALFFISITIIVMWGHTLNLWTTLLSIAILLAIFFVPYLLCRKYSNRIEDILYNNLHATFLRKVISNDKEKVVATSNPITLPKPLAENAVY